ncbi:MAG: rod shape-determining protein MreC [Fusobacteriaceae bacterium]
MARVKLKNQKKKRVNKTIRRVFFWVAIIFALYFFRDKFYNIFDVIKHGAYNVQTQLYIMKRDIRKFYYKISYKKKLEEYNKTYEIQNLGLELELYTKKFATEENERLKKLLDLRDKLRNTKIAKARFTSMTDLYKRFYIELGEPDGIQEDMVVMIGDNLVGKIKYVREKYSVVEMLTDERLLVSATTSRGIFGVLRSSDANLGKLEFIPSVVQDDVEIGDDIFTSGVSDIYPKNLFIGKVIALEHTESKFLVDSGLDLSKITEVFIVTKKPVKVGR